MWFRNLFCSIFHEKWIETYRENIQGKPWQMFDCHKCKRQSGKVIKL